MSVTTNLGLVKPILSVFKSPLHLKNGAILPEFSLMIETYGTLNAEKTNGILICHALSGNHHAAGRHHIDDKRPGWWDLLIGPGKPIDTNRFFIVSSNNIGGCDGSTGPRSPREQSDVPWGREFPQVHVNDWVNSQKLLAEKLGIVEWAAVIGGSLGGMQALDWAVRYPTKVRYCVMMAAAPNLTAQNIAFNEIARQAIMTDPGWLDTSAIGEGGETNKGMAIARMVAHLTYLSADGMTSRFGRELTNQDSRAGIPDAPPIFQVESYLRYQGEQFSSRFDPHTYMLMTKALDHFDIAEAYGGYLPNAMNAITCESLIISFTSDWRFPPSRSREMVNAMITADKKVTYANIKSDDGHDAFLLPNPEYLELLYGWMRRIET